MTSRPFMPKISIHGFGRPLGLDKTGWVKSQPEDFLIAKSSATKTQKSTRLPVKENFLGNWENIHWERIKADAYKHRYRAHKFTF